MTRRVAVIGGGVAGVEAATAAAGAGAEVTLISDGPVGGRGGWDSLLPSKIWLHAAARSGPAVDPAAVRDHIAAATRTWSERESARLAAAGVTLISGSARLLSADSLAVRGSTGGELQLTAEAIIIAAGSLPRFPAELQPDGRRLLAPRHLSSLAVIPAEIAVIGGGATGAEAASLFCALGSRVTWFCGADGALPALPAAAGRRLITALAARGVTIRRHHVLRAEPKHDGLLLHADGGPALAVAGAFLAVGRRPDLERLDLAAAGLAPALTVDAFGRSAVPTIYVVGDAAGGLMLANRARAQAWIAGRHAAGQVVAPFRSDLIVQAVYATPEIACVGRTDCGAAGFSVQVDSRALLQSLIDDDELLELELFVDAAAVLRGAVAVGPHAAELLGALAPAVAAELPLSRLAEVFPAVPTYSELIGLAARRGLSATVAMEPHHD